MSFIDIFVLVVLLVLLVAIIAVLILPCMLLGGITRQRNHPKVSVN